MSKPTREEFLATVKERFPGATCIKADRGLYVVVGHSSIADDIARMANEVDLFTIIEEEDTESFVVRVFGSPWRKRC